ncbi:nucleotidyltransferase family protein [Thermodesulfovibrio yellowstonii]|jgi:predicted nucleotidyltransferase|uniref:Nucleotidyltransferase n=1 Tax=Thermodesulfovibrio yellowstonii (strain ATCC 51303 / DSM 11347 / YP87) TaxID=289376 RepID=B5YIA5_THEYD|nr:nucleotidyltransferase family protein [Thermodesulfovibrio yellowstonii]ACI20621.1 nucleotidyltransferase [Thermodesulfovibrio yellowstonii DSM 11347]MBC7189282.1 nucleotidyltransferase family protein [Candidatus Aerophobetes bacterium]MDI6864540.1 nucleotidyltransferase family protein [Thermodesulfovibrio yellowstonii]
MEKIEKIKDILHKQKEELKNRFGVLEIGIFGSYARGEETKESDIDILVVLDERFKTFDNYVDLKNFLTTLLCINVDLIIKDAIKPRLKPCILEETIYV